MQRGLANQLPYSARLSISIIVAVAVIVCITGCTSPSSLKEVGYYSERGAVSCVSGTSRVCRVGYSSRVRGAQQDYKCACASLGN